MILNADKELTVDQLLNQTWDDSDEHADTEDLWINISYLRQKLASVNSNVTIDGPKSGPFKLTK